LLSTNNAISNSFASYLLNVSISYPESIISFFRMKFILGQALQFLFSEPFLLHIKACLHKHTFILLLLYIFWSAC